MDSVKYVFYGTKKGSSILTNFNFESRTTNLSLHLVLYYNTIFTDVITLHRRNENVMYKAKCVKFTHIEVIYLLMFPQGCLLEFIHPFRFNITTQLKTMLIIQKLTILCRIVIFSIFDNDDYRLFLLMYVLL